MKKIFTTLSILLAGYVYCQNVGINTTGAVGADCSILDLSSTNTGLLVPRISIANTATPTLTGTMVEGVIIYNTNAAIAGTGAGGTGYYYWSVTAARWVNLIDNVAPGSAWMVAGNSGTNPATDYAGTFDAVDFVIRTNNAERVRALSGGNLLVNRTTALFASDLMEAQGNATFPYAINAYTNQGAGIGVWGQVTVNAGSGAGVAGIVGTAGGYFSGCGVSGITTNGSGAGAGVGAQCSVAGGRGVFGQNTAATGTATNSAGIYGYTAQGGVASSGAVMGLNVNNQTPRVTGGIGVMGAGCNQAQNGLVQGNGGAFTGFSYGLYANNVDFAAFQQASIATYDGGGGQMLINAWSAGGTHYKVWAGGAWTVSCVVPDLNDKMVTLHCPETPEFYFQDYGQAQLVNGIAHIDIDPILAKNIMINEKHPLRVFIQLEGDCNGVFVTNKTTTGFDVVELKGGTSNTPFQWSITCNVKDQIENGRTNHLQDLRFEPGPIIEKQLSEEKYDKVKMESQEPVSQPIQIILK